MGLRIGATLAVALALPVAAVVFFHATPFALADVEASVDVCDTAPAADTTVRSSWSGPVLQLAIAQAQNCGDSLDAVAVQRLGGHLFVRTGYHSPSGAQAACYCSHRTRLQVPGLPRQAYSVHVYSWP